MADFLSRSQERSHDLVQPPPISKKSLTTLVGIHVGKGMIAMYSSRKYHRPLI